MSKKKEKKVEVVPEVNTVEVQEVEVVPAPSAPETGRKLENHNLKPRSVSPEVELQNSIKTPTVTLISPHGKEVTVVTSMLAFHLERGFELKE